MVDPAEVVAEVNLVRGTSYRLVRRLPGGSQSGAAISAAVGYGDLIGFALAVDLSALPLIHRGGERMLELLEA